MALLALNTSEKRSSIAIVDKGKVLAEKSWISENNESEKLLPELNNLIVDAGMTISGIELIAVIKGPGPFTALRVSVAIANALAYGLNVKIIGIDSIEYWKKRIELAGENAEVVLNAGGSRVYYKGEIYEFNDFIARTEADINLTGFLKPEFITNLEESGFKWVDTKNLPSFGNLILEFAKSDFKDYKREDVIKPVYFSAPIITKSNKAYK